MKILLVSAFLENHPKIGPCNFLHLTGEGFRKGLTDIGLKVDCFDYRHIAKKESRSPKWEHRFRKVFRRFKKPGFPSWMQELFFKAGGLKRMNQQLLEAAAANKYDLIILTKTELISYSTIPKLNRHTPTWYYFMDPLQKAQKHQAEKYAAFSTWASATRTNIVELFRAAGAQAIFLSEGAGLEYFHPDSDQPKEYDIIFVGTLTKHRQEFIDYCTEQGLEVDTFGKGGKHDFIERKDLGDLYRRSRIVLDFQNTGGNTGFSLRVYEAMACGAMLLSEHTQDFEKIFKQGEEADSFSSPEECVSKIRKYLADEPLCRRIGEAAAKRIQQDFTWQKIAQDLHDTVASHAEKNITRIPVVETFPSEEVPIVL